MDIKSLVQKSVEKKSLVHKSLLNYIENEEPDSFKQLMNIIDQQKIREDKYELKEFLNLISKISNNHHRSTNFINKIEEILKNLQIEIKKNFSNLNIYNIFKKNKRILLFLFNEKIIIPDEIIYFNMTNLKYCSRLYIEYFYPEFKSLYTSDEKYLREKYPIIFDLDSNLFDEKRKAGENDDIICQLIRNDSVDEFIQYVRKNGLDLSSPIKESIFETNHFLIKQKKVTLIEYAAFFGSTRIIQHLLENGVELTPSIFIYAIHSNKAEIIQLLEQKKAEFNSNCIAETIKCHHIKMEKYFEDNYNDIKYQSTYFNYFNFVNIKFNDFLNMSIENIFYFFCKFDYVKFVEYFIQNTDLDYNKTIISIFNVLLHYKRNTF